MLGAYACVLTAGCVPCVARYKRLWFQRGVQKKVLDTHELMGQLLLEQALMERTPPSNSDTDDYEAVPSTGAGAGAGAGSGADARVRGAAYVQAIRREVEREAAEERERQRGLLSRAWG